MLDVLMPEIINLVIVVLTALAGLTTRYVVKFMKEKGLLAKLEKNKALVKIAVQAVEQMHKNLDGAEKFNLAKIELLKLMNDNSIKMTEKELDLLIESVVKEIKTAAKAEQNK